MMRLGVIVQFDADRDFGFIRPADGSLDVFFHGGSLDGYGYVLVQPGQHVAFDAVQGKRGPAAVSVRVLRQEERPQ